VLPVSGWATVRNTGIFSLIALRNSHQKVYLCKGIKTGRGPPAIARAETPLQGVEDWKFRRDLIGGKKCRNEGRDAYVRPVSGWPVFSNVGIRSSCNAYPDPDPA
jgi:hypothetical protein